jgi:hypothetical protein
VVRDISVSDNFTKVYVGSYQPTGTTTYNGFIETDNTNNNYDWRVTVEGTANDEINAVDVNLVWNGTEYVEEVYVTGYFSGTIYFKRYKWYPSPQTTTVWSMSLPQPADVGYFVAKLDRSGNVVWLQSTANPPEYYGEIGNDVDVCVVGSQVEVYTTGFFRGNPYFFHNGGSPVQLSASGAWTSAFVAKYVDNGSTATLSWVKKINDDADNQHDYGYGVCGDASGNVYMCGSIGGTTTIVSGSPLSVEGNDDALVVKYNSAGTVQWTKDFGANGTAAAPSDQARCITYNAGMLHVSGYFNGVSAPWPAGSANSVDGFLIQMVASTGGIMWRDVFGNASGADVVYKHTYSETANKIYVVGSMTGDMWIQGTFSPPAFMISSPNGGTFPNGFFAAVATSSGACGDYRWVGCTNNSSVITTVETYQDDWVYFGGAFKGATLTESDGNCTATNSSASGNYQDGLIGIYLYDPFRRPGPAATQEQAAGQSGLQLKAFPNPAHDVVTISKSSDAVAQIEVLDLSGRRVIDPTVMNGLQTTLDISALNSGMYIVLLTEGDKTEATRISKQ